MTTSVCLQLNSTTTQIIKSALKIITDLVVLEKKDTCNALKSSHRSAFWSSEYPERGQFVHCKWSTPACFNFWGH